MNERQPEALSHQIEKEKVQIAEVPRDNSSTVKQNARKRHSEELKKEDVSLGLNYSN